MIKFGRRHIEAVANLGQSTCTIWSWWTKQEFAFLFHFPQSARALPCKSDKFVTIFVLFVCCACLWWQQFCYGFFSTLSWRSTNSKVCLIDQSLRTNGMGEQLVARWCRVHLRAQASKMKVFQQTTNLLPKENEEEEEGSKDEKEWKVNSVLFVAIVELNEWKNGWEFDVNKWMSDRVIL